MSTSEDTVMAHHRAAATMWDQGGKHYDNVSFAISDALKHAAQRLDAGEGQRILDVGTGTGWSARNAARKGAEVIGVDIAGGLLAAARELSAHVRPPIEFQLADAERLPFADGAFEGIISTFGVMFAADQAQAAAELSRVCCSGGRLVLATWAPVGSVAEFFGIMGKYTDAPPLPASPLAWGDPAHIEKLLGGAFELTFEHGVNHAYHASAEQIWDWYVRGFGPLRQLAASLDAPGAEALKRDVDAFHQHYAGPAGLHIKRDYLLTIGLRR